MPMGRLGGRFRGCISVGTERFVVREEIQFRCYLTLAGPVRTATSEDADEAVAEWRRRAAARFGEHQAGHISVTLHHPAPVLGVESPAEFVVTGLVAPLDSTSP